MIRASVHTLHRQVRAHEAHFRFVTRERYAGTGPVPRAIAVELRMFAGDLAVDLARFEYLRDWPTEDLRLLADLIVTAMLGTVAELLDTRPGDTGADERILQMAQKRLRMILLGVPYWPPPARST
ncbi:hypothetical protein [Amycolatopsis panacis]|uniref:hypothetical protein n=1 Tax=Amycolatopsis panacis TaxID=2340917 RepID=UPI0018F306D7